MRIVHQMLAYIIAIAGIGVDIPQLHGLDANRTEVEFNKPEGLSYFIHEKIRSRLITTSGSHLLTCKLTGPKKTFLLMEFNGAEQPIYPKDNQIKAVLELTPGTNLLRLSSIGGIEVLNYEITRIAPSKPTRIILNSGDPSKRPPEIAITENNDSYSVPTPNIRIQGTAGSPSSQELRVRDQFNNPLVVQTLGDEFHIDHTLREAENRILLQSYFENKLYYQEEIRLNVDDFIILELDSNQNAPGFVSLDQERANYAVCQTTDYYLEGKINGMDTGLLTIELNGNKQQAPIRGGRFSMPLELEPNELNTGRVNVSINNQIFGESFRVLQKLPSVGFESIRSIALDGSIFTDGSKADIDAQTLNLNSPIIRMTGSTVYDGYLSSRVINTTTGHSLEISQQSGNFDLLMPLVEGSNDLIFEIGDTSHPISVRTMNVNVAPVIELTRVNMREYSSSTPLFLSESGYTFFGRVAAVSRGMLRVSQGDASLNIPIVAGVFESDEPFQPNNFEEPIVLSVKFGSRVFKQVIAFPETSSPVD